LSVHDAVKARRQGSRPGKPPKDLFNVSRRVGWADKPDTSPSPMQIVQANSSPARLDCRDDIRRFIRLERFNRFFPFFRALLPMDKDSSLQFSLESHK